jgi:hypothetical protein
MSQKNGEKTNIVGENGNVENYRKQREREREREEGGERENEERFIRHVEHTKTVARFVKLY